MQRPTAAAAAQETITHSSKLQPHCTYIAAEFRVVTGRVLRAAVAAAACGASMQPVKVVG